MSGNVQEVDFSEQNFKRELQALLKSPPQHSVTWKITPEMARIILDIGNKGAGNRPVRKGVVRKYAQAMAAGEWVLTKVPIIFSESHRLLDGQHRLMACVQSGAIFHSTVEFRAPDIAFASVDTGAKRGVTDVFAMKGEENYMVLAGATGWVWRYENDHLSKGWGGHIMPAPLDLWKYMNTEHGSLRDAVRHTFEFKKNGFRTGHQIYAAMCHLCSLKDALGAFKFFEQVATGQHHFQWKPRDPQPQLRRFLMEDEIARGRSESVDDVRKSAYIVLAWNAWREGTALLSFKWRTAETPAEPFPEIR